MSGLHPELGIIRKLMPRASSPFLYTKGAGTFGNWAEQLRFLYRMPSSTLNRRDNACGRALIDCQAHTHVVCTRACTKPRLRATSCLWRKNADKKRSPIDQLLPAAQDFEKLVFRSLCFPRTCAKSERRFFRNEPQGTLVGPSCPQVSRARLEDDGNETHALKLQSAGQNFSRVKCLRTVFCASLSKRCSSAPAPRGIPPGALGPA